jgi:hypothetical protein
MCSAVVYARGINAERCRPWLFMGWLISVMPGASIQGVPPKLLCTRCAHDEHALTVFGGLGVNEIQLVIDA